LSTHLFDPRNPWHWLGAAIVSVALAIVLGMIVAWPA
jgi:ABC-type phosphate transport system auxiliary subunit